MPRKTYTEQFKREAVVFYESTPGATINAIASDLGVNRNCLRTWLDSFGTGTKTDADGEKVASPIGAANSALTWLKDCPMPSASACWNARTSRSGRNERSCARRLNISRKRRTGEPLSVR